MLNSLYELTPLILEGTLCMYASTQPTMDEETEAQGGLKTKQKQTNTNNLSQFPSVLESGFGSPE